MKLWFGRIAKDDTDVRVFNEGFVISNGVKRLSFLATNPPDFKSNVNVYLPEIDFFHGGMKVTGYEEIDEDKLQAVTVYSLYRDPKKSVDENEVVYLVTSSDREHGDTIMHGIFSTEDEAKKAKSVVEVNQDHCRIVWISPVELDVFKNK